MHDLCHGCYLRDAHCHRDRHVGRWGLPGAYERIGHESRSGALFVFFGRRRDAIKVVFFDGTGMCIFYKRLDRGTFRLPEVEGEDTTSVSIDERALDDLLDGIGVEAKVCKKSRARVH